MTPKQEEIIEDIRKASRGGVAPSTTGGIGKRLLSKANHQHLTWAQACETAGVVPYGKRNRDSEVSPEMLARMDARERAKNKTKRKLYKNHKCMKCVWSRLVDESKLFCMMPYGSCMKHRKAGRADYGTFKNQGGKK